MNSVKQQLLEFISNPNYPCIGAKAAAKKKCIEIIILEDLNSSADDTNILIMLYEFIELWKKNHEQLQTACVIFKSPLPTSEIHFEELMWKRLQKLHELDCELYPWNKNLSSNVNSSNFSFSLGGEGFFIVGLHPESSRKARRFPYPTLIFNLHAQFELLREQCIFEKMREKIRADDFLYQGSINPMVEDFGTASEALQYSGRSVPSNHKCPFIKCETKNNWETIDSCTASAFMLKKNDFLIVEDFIGEQVADLYCFCANDSSEFLSSGKSFDYNNTIHFTTNNKLYSNKSNVMLTIEHDEVGVHDFLFAPCNKDTFRILYDNLNPPSGCYEHLLAAFASFNIKEELNTTFNIFMNVAIDNATGALQINPPKSKKGEKIIFKSHMDLIVGLSACAAPKSNNNSLKPVRYKIIRSNYSVL